MVQGLRLFLIEGVCVILVILGFLSRSNHRPDKLELKKCVCCDGFFFLQWKERAAHNSF